jgi:MFS family permease
VLAWLCVLIAVNQLGFGVVVPVLPLYASTFGVSVAAVGLTIGIYGLARFILSLPAGRSADRFGRRPTLALGGVLTVVGSLASAVAPTYGWFLLARFVAGSGAALTLTASQIILADITVPSERGRAMGLYSGFFAFAVGLGPYPGGVLADTFGLPAPFIACAALALLFTILGWLFVPETLRASAHLAPSSNSRATPDFSRQLRLLASNRSFVLVSLIGFSSAVARTGALFSVVPLLMRDRLELSADQIGLGLSLVSLGALCLAYPSGVLVDRFGRKAVIAPGVLIAGVAAFTFAFAPSFGWYLAACAVWSIALGISSAAPSAYAADIAPPGMNAVVMSSFRMLSDAGYVLGPIVLGVVAERQSPTSALSSAGVLLIVSAVLFARLAPETFDPSGHMVAEPAGTTAG